MERKGFGIRLGALVIDIVILIVIQAILSLIMLGSLQVGFSTGTPTSEDVAANVGRLRVFGIVSTLISLAYWALEIFRGQSVGKMILGLRIGSDTGAVPGDVSRLGIRYALKNSATIVNLLVAITGIGLLGIVGFVAALAVFVGCFFALGQNRQALHDIIAKTAVYGAASAVPAGFAPVMPGAVPPGGTAVPPPASTPPQA